MLFPFKPQGKISETVQQLLLQVRDLFRTEKRKGGRGKEEREMKERDPFLVCFFASHSLEIVHYSGAQTVKGEDDLVGIRATFLASCYGKVFSS